MVTMVPSLFVWLGMPLVPIVPQMVAEGEVRALKDLHPLIVGLITGTLTKLAGSFGQSSKSTGGKFPGPIFLFSLVMWLLSLWASRLLVSVGGDLTFGKLRTIFIGVLRVHGWTTSVTRGSATWRIHLPPYRWA